jgi:2,3-dihydroxybenzoate-AMP ligase
MPDLEMGERVCAYIVPKDGQKINLELLVAFLKSKKVTPFLMPERVEVVSELPISQSGQKVDRKVLEQDISRKLQQEACNRTFRE